jgi:hypothetical protein
MVHVEIECQCVPFVGSFDGISAGCLNCRGTLRITRIQQIRKMLKNIYYSPVIKNGLKNDTR